MNEDTYIDFAKALSDLISAEREVANRKRGLHEIKEELLNGDNDGSCGVTMSDHAFKQISERLETLSMESSTIYRDVIKPDEQHESLLLASNMKSFIITMLSNAKSKGHISEDNSKSGGNEYRYTVDLNRWSGDKKLQFIAIVEGNVIKTGFFNWV